MAEEHVPLQYALLVTYICCVTSAYTLLCIQICVGISQQNNGSHQIWVKMWTMICVKKYWDIPFSSARGENCGSEFRVLHLAWEGQSGLWRRRQVFLSTVMLRSPFCKKYYQDLNIRGNIGFLTMKQSFNDLGEKLTSAMVRCACFLGNLWGNWLQHTTLVHWWNQRQRLPTLDPPKPGQRESV